MISYYLNSFSRPLNMSRMVDLNIISMHVIQLILLFPKTLNINSQCSHQYELRAQNESRLSW